MKSYLILVCVLLGSSLFGLGCAFKESAHPPVEPPTPVVTPIVTPEPMPVPIKQPDPVLTPTVNPILDPISTPAPLPSPKVEEPPKPERKGVLKTKAGKREFKLQDGETITTIQTPISLPPEVHLDFQLSVDSPDFAEHSIAKIVATGKLNLTEGTGTPLVVKDFSPLSSKENSEKPSDNTWVIQIQGLEKILSIGEESEAFIVLQFFTHEGKEAFRTIQVPVVSPPSKMRSEQSSLAAFEAKKKPIDSIYKTYISLGQRLDLIQIVQVRNKSNRSVHLNIPLRPKGSLFSKFQRIDFSQQPCSYSTSKSDGTDVFSTDFYLLPLQEGVAKGFLGFINQAIQRNQFGMDFTSGEEKLIGIYAQGEKVQTLVTQGYQKKAFTTQSVVTGCRSRCGDPRKDMYHWDTPLKAFEYWHNQGWPGASKICESLRKTYRIPPENGHPNEGAMNECAIWELSNGTQPWDARRFCQSPGPGNPWHYNAKEMWNVEKSATNITVGVQNTPLFLLMDTESAAVEASFLFDGVVEDSFFRKTKNIIHTHVLQAQ